MASGPPEDILGLKHLRWEALSLSMKALALTIFTATPGLSRATKGFMLKAVLELSIVELRRCRTALHPRP